MNYKEIIVPQQIENYKEQHRIFYSTLNSMIFDISFIEACAELQDPELYSDWITIKCLHRCVFENLVSKVYRCFFDNSGMDSVNIFNYKNNVIGKFLKEEYRQSIIDKINNLPIETDFVTRKKELEKNILSIRRDFIAHRLLVTSDETIIDLNEIKMLFNYGCALFQTLSFETKDFYSFVEGDGYDFSKEIDYTYKATRYFIKTAFLTSKYITKIDCKIDEDCNDTIKKRIQSILDDLNSNR